MKYCPEWQKGIESLLVPLERLKKHIFALLDGIPKEMS